MTGKQAGYSAVGILVVAILIVIIGSYVNGSDSPFGLNGRDPSRTASTSGSKGTNGERKAASERDTEAGAKPAPDDANEASSKDDTGKSAAHDKSASARPSNERQAPADAAKGVASQSAAGQSQAETTASAKAASDAGDTSQTADGSREATETAPHQASKASDGASGGQVAPSGDQRNSGERAAKAADTANGASDQTAIAAEAGPSDKGDGGANASVASRTGSANSTSNDDDGTQNRDAVVDAENEGDAKRQTTPVETSTAQEAEKSAERSQENGADGSTRAALAAQTAAREAGQSAKASSRRSERASTGAEIASVDEGDDRTGGKAASPSVRPPGPSFDIVRVEPDGSTLIAGHARPNAKVMVMNGDDTVSSTTADAGGDFVAMPDQPLKPGNYELRLRDSDDSGDSATSRESATISVPKDKNGDVLAMVNRPGAASDLLSVPTGKTLARSLDGTAKQAGERNASDEAARETAASAANSRSAPSSGKSVASAKSSESASSNASGKNGPTEIASVDAGSQKGEGASSAAIAPSGQGSSEPHIHVDAVEIDGGDVYVAGAATAGDTVRIYVDDAFVGQSRATGEGRFVVNGSADLKTGKHSVRADLVDPESGDVLARAAVPFTRPEGDRYTAVARSTEGADDGQTATARRREEANRAVSKLWDTLKADVPDGNAIEAARAHAEDRLQALARNAGDGAGANEDRQDASGRDQSGTQASRATPAKSAFGSSADADASDDNTANRETASVRDAARQALLSLRSLPDLKGAPDIAAPELKTMRAKVADIANALPPVAGVPAVRAKTSATGNEAEPATSVQPALEPTDDYVIIRKGDTLWQISRRTYGRGVRYTTIYLANSQQIRDPNYILPGQVFDVPKKSDAPIGKVEKLHRALQHDGQG
ncbi:LysM peptidoglycan-binding domain-containing protein [Pararhizobium mangrovi]|uniref:LysM peptidoglycan-binding domain-containing protein n=1 Tax=Pararhizobium mangrovi TaxID=2590452 RepID=A0A506UFH0_9HYPH|nr:LysM peptidoglycan-binding domain-containing protein [Pararhizobium mangrovi]TPW32021.1 LysM peptidoglycan-binding domain-containing protein [Pararhizobium mangrovi]